MNNKLLLITFSSLFLLAGCGGGGKHKVTDNETGIETLANAPAASDAGALDDVAQLRSDLSAIFGDADGEPIPVEDGDTVQDVIDRGRS